MELLGVVVACVAGLVAVSGQTVARGGGACKIDDDCSLGGVCTAGGCVCDPTWTGPWCGVLYLKKARTGKAFFRETESSWGGSVVWSQEDGKYHMFVSDMSRNCSLSKWESNSRIVHAVSSDPEGPYEQVDVTVPVFGTNPTVHYTGGEYVVYHIGEGKQEKPPVNCTGASPHDVKVRTRTSPAAAASDHPNMAVSTSVNGAFAQIPSSGGTWAFNNPGAYFHPNGSVLLISKISCTKTSNSSEFCRQFTVSIADSFRGPFQNVRNLEVYGEDPYVWRDARGHYHMLFQGGNYDPILPTYVGHFHTAFSRDGFDWTVANHSIAYPPYIELVDGSAVAVARRERCQVLFNADGLPTYLFNGAGNETFSFTSVQPINVD